MIKKTIIYLFYIFLLFCFTLLVCEEKNILANLTNGQESKWSSAGRSLIVRDVQPFPTTKHILELSNLIMKLVVCYEMSARSFKLVVAINFFSSGSGSCFLFKRLELK